MKALIVYTSQSGFTKRYAEWIAKKVDGTVVPLKKVEKKSAAYFEEYDAIVYGGWTMAGKLVKVEWFKNHISDWKEKKLAVYCCGATSADNPDIGPFVEALLDDEQKQYAKAFYCQAGLDYSKMKFFSKIAMKSMVAMLQNKPDKTQAEIDTMNMLSKSFDISDEKYADVIADYLLGK